MAIDPSIPLSIRPPAPGPSVLETYSQVLQLQGQRAQAQERTAAAAEAQAKRAREAQIEQALQAGISLDPVTKQPTFDYEKALGRQLPPAVLFEVKKVFDENAERMARTQTANLTAAEKRAAYLAGTARSLQAQQFDPDLGRLEIGAAKQIGALDPTMADQLLDAIDRDGSAALQQFAAGALARAGKAEEQALQRIEVPDPADPTKSVYQFVRPKEGATYPMVQKAGDTPTLGTFGDYLTRVAQAAGRPVVALTPRQVAQAKAEYEAAGRAPATASDERLVSIVGPDGKPVYVRESAAVGKTPGSAGAGGEGGLKLGAAQQDDLATMLTVEQLVQDIQAIDKQAGGLPGVGPVEGRFAASARGSGGAVGETLRNTVGNIQGTIAKLRGGTSFTPGEQALLDTYTPTTTDTDAAIRTKLVSLTAFIQKKRANVLRVASGQYELPPRAPTPTETTTAPPAGPTKIGRFEVEVR